MPALVEGIGHLLFSYDLKVTRLATIQLSMLNCITHYCMSWASDKDTADVTSVCNKVINFQLHVARWSLDLHYIHSRLLWMHIQVQVSYKNLSEITEFLLTAAGSKFIPEASSRFPRSCSNVCDCERLKLQPWTSFGLCCNNACWLQMHSDREMKIVHADPHYEKQRLGARDKYPEASTISSQLLHGDCSHGW